MSGARPRLRLEDLTPSEKVRFLDEVEAHARDFNLPLLGDPADAAGRYVTEGFLKDLDAKYGLGPVWDAVKDHVLAHPQILTWSDEEVAAAKEDRVATVAPQIHRLIGEAQQAAQADNAAELLDGLDAIAAIDPEWSAGLPWPVATFRDRVAATLGIQDSAGPAPASSVVTTDRPALTPPTSEGTTSHADGPGQETGHTPGPGPRP